MSTPKVGQILKLYKDLLRYGQNLKYTDKDYFCRRVRTQFRENKSLTDAKEISHNFEKGIVLLVKRSVK